ncbi:MAG: M20 family peptidase [Myxococcota bacterium]
MKKVLTALAALLGAVVVVLLINTARFGSKQVPPPPASTVVVDVKRAASHLSEAVRFKTISHQDRSKVDAEEFRGLHAFLERAFPQVHQKLQKDVVAEHSLLFTWKGTDPALAPAMLMAHMDVVPVEAGTEEQWTHPPFEGREVDGYIWGRGSIDDKGGMMAILEAVEMLLEKGHAPRRTFLMAFGHDEEVIGNGAAAIRDLLVSRGVKSLHYVNDEGLLMVQGVIQGVGPPVGALGVAQKGYLSVELVVNGEGGHSSMPPPHTAVGILSTAIHRLEANPMPASISGVARRLFEHVGPEMPLSRKIVFANLWLLSPVVKQLALGKNSTAALIRTTTAATMFEGSVKENVLPIRARAVVNFRILPGDTVASVVEHVKDVIDDERVQVQVLPPANEPSAVSDDSAPNFAMFARTLRQVEPSAVVAPSLVVSATDARHYEGMSNDIYRFRPFLLQNEDIKRIHGTNERASLQDVERLVKFYAQLILNTDAP